MKLKTILFFFLCHFKPQPHFRTLALIFSHFSLSLKTRQNKQKRKKMSSGEDWGGGGRILALLPSHCHRRCKLIGFPGRFASWSRQRPRRPAPPHGLSLRGVSDAFCSCFQSPARQMLSSVASNFGILFTGLYNLLMILCVYFLFPCCSLASSTALAQRR